MQVLVTAQLYRFLYDPAIESLPEMWIEMADVAKYCATKWRPMMVGKVQGI